MRSEDGLRGVVNATRPSALPNANHLLVGHDILHDHLFVFLADGLPQLLLVLVD